MIGVNILACEIGTKWSVFPDPVTRQIESQQQMVSILSHDSFSLWVFANFVLNTSYFHSPDYRSSVLIDQAKKRDTKAKKAYQKLKKDPFPKLYDKPPHKRHKRKAA